MSTSRHRPSSHPASGRTSLSERVRLRRKRERGSHEREVIDAILDEALIAHLGHRRRARPAVRDPHAARTQRRCRLLPRLDRQPHAARARRRRAGVPDRVAARRPRARALGDAPLGQLPLGRCCSDGAARGRAPRRSAAALEAIVEHIVPGRWPRRAPPTENEMKATAVLALAIDEASAKIRSGPPLDDEEDYALPVWAGVIPLSARPASRSPTRAWPAGTHRSRRPLAATPDRAGRARADRRRRPSRARRAAARSSSSSAPRSQRQQQTPVALEHAGSPIAVAVGAPATAASCTPIRLAVGQLARARRCAGSARARRARARGRARGIEQRGPRRDLLGVGHARLVLLDEQRAVGAFAIERREQQVGAELLATRGASVP